MPDDLFEPLTRSGVDVQPLPAAEVRRRGDRLRRRRTALIAASAALAVALVVVPASVLTRGDDDSAPPVRQPTATATSLPTSTPTAAAPAGPDDIPADFPLDRGMESAASGSGGSGPGSGAPSVGLRLCGAGGWARGALSQQTASAFIDNAEDTRELRIYPTAARATAALTRVRTALRNCRTDDTSHGPYTVTAVEASADSTDVMWVSSDASGRPVGDLVQVVRVGRAVLATRDSSEWTATSGVAYAPQRIADTRPVVDAMCVWSADGCASASSAGTNTVEPVDFSGVVIERGLSASPDVTVSGPSAATFPGAEEGPCPATGIWPGDGVGRRAVTASGPEYRDAREVRVFASTEQAVAAVAAVRSSIDSCSAQGPQGESGRVVRGFTADTGYDSATWIIGYERSLGGEVHQVTRVGRAVLSIVLSGEASLDAVGDGVPERTKLTRELAPALCAFTEAGC